MEIKKRKVKHPNRMKVTKLDDVYSLIEDAQETISGTEITEELLNSANWREDDSLSFKASKKSQPPQPDGETVKILETIDNNVWVVPTISDPINLSEIGDFDSEQKTQLENKLDKVTTTASNDRLYGVSQTGSQKMITVVTSSSSASTIPTRTSIAGADGLGAPIFTGTPTENGHAANKKYVDDEATKINTTVANFVNNTTIIQNPNGGFAAGNLAATSTGGAIGGYASASAGGGAIGYMTAVSTGGAIGSNASATTGFAGGYNAKSTATGAVQLGTGTNATANTLQFNSYPLLDASGKIPNDRLNFTLSKQANGYTILPNGVIIQWGTSTSGTGGWKFVNFPLTFPTACTSIQFTVVGGDNGGAYGLRNFATDDPKVNLDGFSRVYVEAQTSKVTWLAIGY